MTGPKLQVEEVEYAQEAEAIRAVRFAVFVDEQSVPPELEIDGEDERCSHVLATIDSIPVGTGRLLQDGHIGRLAVLKDYRGRGIGVALMHCLMQVGRERGIREFVLSAQLQACGFYEALGFESRGETFWEAGIEHVEMVQLGSR